MDTTSIVIRRISNGQSPFSPDRHHLHHFFIFIGMSDRQTLFIIIFLSTLMADWNFNGYLVILMTKKIAVISLLFIFLH